MSMEDKSTLLLLNSLVSSYLRKDNLDSFVQKEHFFQLIQFLSFLRNLESSKQFLEDQAYLLSV